jgi:CheY-like chemotaxis protein
VNDDEDAVFLLHRTIEREFAGATVSECRSGTDALQFLAGQPVDAIVTDNHMPGMDGLTLVRLIREQDVRTPILMLTGSDHMESAALGAGVTCFVSAGSWDEIRRKIRDLLVA